MMKAIRFANHDDIERLKDIWKSCFGDSDAFIEIYFSNRFRANNILLLIYDCEIASMLTMMPVETVTPDNRRIKTVMLYAIATDPEYQARGFAVELMEYCRAYLNLNDVKVNVLVPAERTLFDYYRKQGYKEGFYIREAQLTHWQIARLPVVESPEMKISIISPCEYNQRRNQFLKGRFYLAYPDEDIVYQQTLSQLSGADIYEIDCEGTLGCVAIERVNSEKVILKDLLIPERFLFKGLQEITVLHPATHYIVRTPTFLAQVLGGSVRPFGMVLLDRELDGLMEPQKLAYLGLAFD